MEKEQNSKTEENINKKTKSSEASENNKESKEEKKPELSPEDKIKELEEKLLEHLQKWRIKEEGLKKKKMMLLNMEVFHLQESLLI